MLNVVFWVGLIIFILVALSALLGWHFTLPIATAKLVRIILAIIAVLAVSTICATAAVRSFGNGRAGLIAFIAAIVALIAFLIFVRWVRKTCFNSTLQWVLWLLAVVICASAGIVCAILA